MVVLLCIVVAICCLVQDMEITFHLSELQQLQRSEIFLDNVSSSHMSCIVYIVHSLAYGNNNAK